eukprot:26343-Pelagococcus_subviridis.AAC.10
MTSLPVVNLLRRDEHDRVHDLHGRLKKHDPRHRAARELRERPGRPQRAVDGDDLLRRRGPPRVPRAVRRRRRDEQRRRDGRERRQRRRDAARFDHLPRRGRRRRSSRRLVDVRVRRRDVPRASTTRDDVRPHLREPLARGEAVVRLLLEARARGALAHRQRLPKLRRRGGAPGEKRVVAVVARPGPGPRPRPGAQKRRHPRDLSRGRALSSVSSALAPRARDADVVRDVRAHGHGDLDRGGGVVVIVIVLVDESFALLLRPSPRVSLRARRRRRRRGFHRRVDRRARLARVRLRPSAAPRRPPHDPSSLQRRGDVERRALPVDASDAPRLRAIPYKNGSPVS